MDIQARPQSQEPGRRCDGRAIQRHVINPFFDQTCMHPHRGQERMVSRNSGPVHARLATGCDGTRAAGSERSLSSTSENSCLALLKIHILKYLHRARAPLDSYPWCLPPAGASLLDTAWRILLVGTLRRTLLKRRQARKVAHKHAHARRENKRQDRATLYCLRSQVPPPWRV